MYKLHEEQRLSIRIMHRILQEIKAGIYQDLSRLPPEVEIAETLGVSRTVVPGPS